MVYTIDSRIKKRGKTKMEQKGLNEKIKKLRQEKGITQKSLAEYLEVDQSFISKIESNERNINVEIVEKLADLFACSVRDLVNDDRDVKGLSLSFRSKIDNVTDLEHISYANKVVKDFIEVIDKWED